MKRIPCPHCGGQIRPPEGETCDRSQELCTCPTGPLWGEILNVTPPSFRLEQGQEEHPEALGEGFIPVYASTQKIYKQFTPTQFRGWIVAMLIYRDKRREELLRVASSQPLPMPINQIVQLELSRCQVDLATGQVRQYV